MTINQAEILINILTHSLVERKEVKTELLRYTTGNETYPCWMIAFLLSGSLPKRKSLRTGNFIIYRLENLSNYNYSSTCSNNSSSVMVFNHDDIMPMIND